MQNWQILMETAPGVFTPTGEVLTDHTPEQVQAAVEARQAETGRCHAAQLSG